MSLPLCHPPPLFSPQQITTKTSKNALAPCLSMLPPSSSIYILSTRVHCAHHMNVSNFLESFGVGRYITDDDGDVTLQPSTNLLHVDAVDILLHRSLLPSPLMTSPYLERSPSECLISIVEDPIILEQWRAEPSDMMSRIIGIQQQQHHFQKVGEYHNSNTVLLPV